MTVEHTPYPEAATVVVIRSVDGVTQVYLVQRAKKRDIGKWENSGGKVDPGEFAHEAAYRELKEELGIDASVLNHVTSQLRQGWLVSVYTCHEFTGIIGPAEDTFSVGKWFSLGETKALDMTEDSRWVLEEVFGK